MLFNINNISVDVLSRSIRQCLAMSAKTKVLALDDSDRRYSDAPTPLDVFHLCFSNLHTKCTKRRLNDSNVHAYKVPIFVALQGQWWWWGSCSVAVSFCTTAHSVHARFAKIFGASLSETTMRPIPRWGSGLWNWFDPAQPGYD